jgi:hypothetical protein
MLTKLLPLTFLFTFITHAQSPWQGEWGSFSDAKTMLGGRVSISGCKDNTCQFDIERNSGTGRVGTSANKEMKLLSETTATARLDGGEGDCVLAFTRQGDMKPGIVIAATGKSCLSYYGTGTNATFAGTYPLRSKTNYTESHRDECFFDDSPAKLTICSSPELAKLEQDRELLADEFPLHPPAKDENVTMVGTHENEAILGACDKDHRPAQCLESHYRSDIQAMQAKKDAYIDGTTQRGDAAQGHELALKIAGRYRHTFGNADVQGHEYNSTDTMTLKPVGAASISFEIELNFYNGHSCSISGGALYRKDGSFVFDDDPAKAVAPFSACRLALIPDAKGVTFKDIEGSACKMSYCGARGSLDGGGFTFNQRVAATPANK